MVFGLIAATISSFFLAVMLIFDRLMMGDCYENKPDLAWIVSSLCGSVFGIFTTLMVWVTYGYYMEIPISAFFSTMFASIFPIGFLMLLAGALNIQVMRPYFKLFSAEYEGDRVDETLIALWLAAAPICIFVASALLSSFVPSFVAETGLKYVVLDPVFGLAVLGSVIALMGFEYVGSDTRLSLKKYHEIVKMLFYITAYSLLISAILRVESIGIFDVLVLQMYYWIGFAAAGRMLFFKSGHDLIKEGSVKLRAYALPILAVEIAGMFVYFFEFFSLSEVDPTLVNLIIGSHVVLVFIFTVILSKHRAVLVSNQKFETKVFGLSVSTFTLPEDKFTFTKLFWFMMIVIMLFITISLV